jgi:hypothetical protein
MSGSASFSIVSAGDRTPAAVWFAYTPDRKGEHPKEHLSSLSGTSQADYYAGFEQTYDCLGRNGTPSPYL